MNAIEEETSDAVPYDIPSTPVTGERTVLVRLDAERPTNDADQDGLEMLPRERELLRVIEITFAEYRKHQRTWSHSHLLLELGKLLGMHTAFELMTTSIDAKIQASLWGDKLSRYNRTA